MDSGNEAGSAGGSHLRNPDLSSVSGAVGEVLTQYGWLLLAAGSAVYLLVQHLRHRRPVRNRDGPEAAHLQDAAVVSRRQEAMEAARRRMQQELDARAAVFLEKQRQLEEEKRRQKIETWENMQQGRSCREQPKHPQGGSGEAGSSAAVLKPKTDKKPLRSTDYSPLSGQGGGSCAWRPGRRGPSAGG